MTVSNFDVLKRMSAENRDIRLADFENLVHMQKTKAGTQVTIGVQGDVIPAITTGRLVGCLLLWDKAQFEAVKAAMEGENPVCCIRCGAPYDASGNCSQRHEGPCQGGWGERHG